MSGLAINAEKWFSSEWALQKGLYSEVFEDNDQMDNAIEELAGIISKSHVDATVKLKEIFWSGTEHWDKLLSKRAEISGKLILSDFSKNAIQKIQKK